MEPALSFYLSKSKFRFLFFLDATLYPTQVEPEAAKMNSNLLSCELSPASVDTWKRSRVDSCP